MSDQQPTRPPQPDDAGERSTGPRSGSSVTARATTADLVRQVVVLLGSLVAAVAAFAGSGAFGSPDQQQVGDGALSADATLVAPGESAFSIWSVIYTGLVAYAVWQVLPAQRADARQRAVGWLVLVTMLLNAAWISVVQAELLGLSVPVIVALLVALVVVLVRLEAQPPASRVEAVVLDGTMGLYLGWVSVATIANVAAVLTSAGWTEILLGPEAWTVVVLTVAALVGAGLAAWTRGRLAIGAAMGWGLAWIAIARSTAEPESTVAAVAAGTAAVVVVAATVVARLRRP